MTGADTPGEFELIARFFAPLAGPGAFGLADDAATLDLPAGESLVVTKDMIVEGVHFFGEDAPASIARKALAVNLSDLAAKGAHPLGFVLGFGRTRKQGEAWLAGFAAGLAALSRESGCALLGGDTVNAPALTLSITAFGTVPRGRMVPRQGGAPGDLVYVSGTIGDAALGLRLRLAPDAPWARALEPEHRHFLFDRYLHPRPRNALSPALLAHARGAMDVSDGLVGDADKLASRLGGRFEIGDVPLSDAARAALLAEPALIETLLTGGDDYEILCVIPPDQAGAFEGAAREAGVPMARIGTLGEAGGVRVWRNPDGRERRFTRRAYAHSF
ncbi:MAG: thiamine-phosphate kinase [Methylobacterium sp.]|nr:thiamine-phosphate kinase [Methylobacterium sp.]MCA3615878.1 thiamine-phosphate kinase [Methylobacterium sp.]MCA3625946.1 thiamine-phosphate kinase [Methylobacterium sp.]MCA4910331.1 thiamine-phosphate kinase [Methylobacterium sp.]